MTFQDKLPAHKQGRGDLAFYEAHSYFKEGRTKYHGCSSLGEPTKKGEKSPLEREGNPVVST